MGALILNKVSQHRTNQTQHRRLNYRYYVVFIRPTKTAPLGLPFADLRSVHRIYRDDIIKVSQYGKVVKSRVDRSRPAGQCVLFWVLAIQNLATRGIDYIDYIDFSQLKYMQVVDGVMVQASMSRGKTVPFTTLLVARGG